jgi:hypothetical protein
MTSQLERVLISFGLVAGAALATGCRTVADSGAETRSAEDGLAEPAAAANDGGDAEAVAAAQARTRFFQRLFQLARTAEECHFYVGASGAKFVVDPCTDFGPATGDDAAGAFFNRMIKLARSHEECALYVKASGRRFIVDPCQAPSSAQSDDGARFFAAQTALAATREECEAFASAGGAAADQGACAELFGPAADPARRDALFDRMRGLARTGDECRRYVLLSGKQFVVDPCVGLDPRSADKAGETFFARQMTLARTHGECTFYAKASGRKFVADPCSAVPGADAQAFFHHLGTLAVTHTECTVYNQASGTKFVVDPCQL